MNISERIRFLRKEHLHITQESLGEPLGLTRANIANIEAGRIAVTERVILSICKEFNVNENWLRTGDGEMFEQLSEQQQLNEVYRFVIERQRFCYCYRNTDFNSYI